MSIDYARMQKVYPKQKAALTRALKTGDIKKIIATIATTTEEWDEIGAWPDGWARWQRALDDALLKYNREHYSDDDYEPLPNHIDLRDLS